MHEPLGTAEAHLKEQPQHMMDEGTSPRIGLELGHQANMALQHIHVRALLAIRARATFRPIHDHQVAPVLPCEECRDGGLRVVGSVRGRVDGHVSWQRVHACDTCGVLRHYEIPGPPSA